MAQKNSQERKEMLLERRIRQLSRIPTSRRYASTKNDNPEYRK